MPAERSVSSAPLDLRKGGTITIEIELTGKLTITGEGNASAFQETVSFDYRAAVTRAKL